MKNINVDTVAGFISFPKAEHKDIKKRLSAGKDTSSLRVLSELDKYKRNKLYATEWGDIIKITKVSRLHGIHEYKWKKYLTKRDLKDLGGEREIDHITFKKI